MDKRLILLRHGETGFPGKYIGSTDVALVKSGREQIKRLKPLFARTKIDLLLASPMLRCRQSCEILFPDYSVSFAEELREIDFGRWEGLSFTEIKHSHPGHISQWADWSVDFCFPGGEKISSFIERIAVIGRKIEKAQETNIFVVAHGGVIRALICWFLRLAPENYLLFKLDKAKFAVLDLFSEGGVLTGFNMGATWEG